MTTIQIRINEKDKKEAKKIFDDLGLDMSSAIKIFLKKVSDNKGLPFLLLTENGLTLEQEREIFEAAKEAKRGKNVSKPMSGKEAMSHLKSL